ncbi:MAG TPA: P-loop NTPase fold protein, partial [Thermoanaerobaculia bacterium]
MESPTSANAPASGTRLPPYRYSRFWFSLAVNIFLLSTLLALLQPRDPDGEFSWLRPYEPAAQKALPLIKADLNAVFIESPNAIWFGGNNGVVVVTADDGKTFKRLPADTAGDVTLGPLTLTSVTDTASTSTSVTDTASDTASISTSVTDTSDTASTRTSIPGPAFDTAGTDTASTRFDPPDHTAPDFFAGDVVALRVSGRRAVAVMRDGFEYYSLDRGARWRFDDQRRTLGDALLANGSWLRSISFYADTPVDALDAHGRLSGRSLGDYATLPTSDVIARWTDQGAGLDATARRGEITLNALRRPTRTWRIDRTIHPNALFFTRNNGGWLVGDGGVMLRLDPATNRWLRVASKTTADLHGVAFTPDGQRGWAAGARGAVLQSVDGGVTWRRRTREWTGGPQDDGSSGASWPGVWWLLANAFLTLPFLGVAARALPQPKDEQGEASVADVPSSDRPLQAGDPDPLNMRAIALAISRFLRNDKTQPPLTIAITGEWGSGKSSLMNLLRADLVRFGFRPVWFNAWHHQKEEHLLASLLQSVRLQAVPSWWTAENLFFRARLIWIRGVKHRAGLLLLLFLFGVAIAYEQRHDHGPFSFFTDAVATSVDRPLPDLVKSLPSDFLQRFELVPLLFLISVCVTAWKGLHAFGVEPGKLLATISGSARVRDLNAQISF